MISQNRPKKSQKKRIVLIYPNNSQQIAEKNKKKCSLPVPHAPQYGIRLDGGGVWNDPAGMPATGFRGFPFGPVTRGDWQHFKTGTRDTQRVLVPKGWDWYTLTHGHLEPNTHTHTQMYTHTHKFTHVHMQTPTHSCIQEQLTVSWPYPAAAWQVGHEDNAGGMGGGAVCGCTGPQPNACK